MVLSLGIVLTVLYVYHCRFSEETELLQYMTQVWIYMVMFIPLWKLTISIIICMARIVDLEYRTTDTESSAEATKVSPKVNQAD